MLLTAMIPANPVFHALHKAINGEDIDAPKEQTFVKEEPKDNGEPIKLEKPARKLGFGGN